MRVLIVEDERHLNDLLLDYVLDAYPDAEVKQLFDGFDALAEVKSVDYDILLLDVMLPHVDGFDIVRELRKTSSTPVLMLSALSDEHNQIKGYELGIDEFVSKPYSPRLVMKKMDAILSRHKGDATSVRTVGMLAVDVQAHRLEVDGEETQLNKKEWDLLMLFLDRPAHVFTRDDLLNRIWGYDYFGDSRTVDTHIKRLRQKLGPASDYIKTVYKTGYKFEV